jgi:hypothetical protein
MTKSFPDWLNEFAVNQLTDESGLQATAEMQDHDGKEDEQTMAHVDEAEQDKRMEKADTEGYAVEDAGANPDEKHFQDGESASEKAFNEANKRDLTTPEGRYAFDNDQLLKMADQVTTEILADIVANALTPAEEMMNREVPLAQLASVVKDVKASLHQNGLRRASFSNTMERIAEVVNLSVPLEITVGDSSAAPAPEMMAPMAPEAPAADMGMDMGMGDEPMTPEAGDEMGSGMMSEAENMFPTARNTRQNRFAK